MNKASIKQQKERVKHTLSLIRLGVISFSTVLFVPNSHALPANTSAPVVESILINSSQTAINPDQVGNMMNNAAKVQAASIQATSQAYRIKDAIDDLTPGKGIPNSMFCKAQNERTQVQTAGIVTNDATSREMLIAASTYTNDNASKLADRTRIHLERFCDTSEVAQGTCILPDSGLSGADSNYSTIIDNPVLKEDQLEASYAFTRNIIDPASVQIEGCNTQMCNTSVEVNRAYQGLASMAQNAFVSQINDSLVTNYQDAGTDQNIKMDANGNIITGSRTASTTSPSSSTPSTSSKNSDVIIFGDDIANKLKDIYRLQGTTSTAAAKPGEILDNMAKFKGTNPNAFKDKTVIISSGYSFANGDASLDTIKAQLIMAKTARKVILIGVADNYKQNGKTGTVMNANLEQLAKKYGATFTGGFSGDADKIHPSKYEAISLGITR